MDECSGCHSSQYEHDFYVAEYATDDHTCTTECSSFNCYENYMSYWEPGCTMLSEARWARSNARYDSEIARFYIQMYRVYDSYEALEIEPSYGRFARKNAQRIYRAKSGRIVASFREMTFIRDGRNGGYRASMQDLG